VRGVREGGAPLVRQLRGRCRRRGVSALIMMPSIFILRSELKVDIQWALPSFGFWSGVTPVGLAFSLPPRRYYTNNDTPAKPL
jgi:hypothetical protein